MQRGGVVRASGTRGQERANDAFGHVFHAGAHAAAEAEVVTNAFDQKEFRCGRDEFQSGLNLLRRAEWVLRTADEKRWRLELRQMSGAQLRRDIGASVRGR